jgi:hypothetical protein
MQSFVAAQRQHGDAAAPDRRRLGLQGRSFRPHCRKAAHQRSDVLALSFAVTYWDRLGWKDTFAQAKFTDRQWAYARAWLGRDLGAATQPKG